MADIRLRIVAAACMAWLAAAPAAWAGEPAPAAPATAKAEAKPLPATIPGGYRLQKIKGELAYCRKVVLTGTTIPKQECLTPEAIEEMQRVGQAQRDGLLQHLPMCVSANAACASN